MNNMAIKKNRKQVVFRTPWFFVEEEFYGRARDPLGGRPFYRIITNSGVAVLAVTKEKKIVLVKQFRLGIGKETLELPSGAVDRRESSRHAALRELYEETGYRAKRLVPLARLIPHMGERINSTADIFFAPNAVKDKNFSPKERIGVKLVSPATLKKMILRGGFRHKSGIIALQIATWKKLICCGR